MEALGLVLATGVKSRLKSLTNCRPASALPFGGRYRLIDFSLSNFVNSGIYDIGIITQYLPHSLHRHIGIGRPWDLDLKNGGVTILQPRTGMDSAEKRSGWYRGNLHSVSRNLNYIKQKSPDYVLITLGNSIGKVDYKRLIKYHQEKEAEITVLTKEIKNKGRRNCFEVDDQGRITSCLSNSKNSSLEVYLFDSSILMEILDSGFDNKILKFNSALFCELITKYRVFSCQHTGYWKTIDDIKSFWKSNLELTDLNSDFDLYDEEWPIYTRSSEKPPVKLGNTGKIKKSVVANGAIINGEVKNSVIFPGCFIREGAEVSNSVVLPDVEIGFDSVVDRCIIDEGAEIKESCMLKDKDGEISIVNKEAEVHSDSLKTVLTTK